MSEQSSSSSNGGSSAGCLGCFIALFLSIKTWGWTWWAFLHFLLGWIYVGYWVVFKSGWI
jgi:hypothetical protein